MGAAVALTGEQVRAWRLVGTGLAPRAVVPGDGLPGAAVAVARRLCGVQAQVASAAAQAVGARLDAPGGAPHADAVVRAAVDAALRDRALVRTWSVRGTLHLHPVDDVAAYLALVASAGTWRKGAWQKAFATLPVLAALTEAVVAALDGPPLSREELAAAVLEATGDPALAEHLRSSGGALLKPLAWQGLVCSGPPDPARVTFTRPDRWLPGWRGLPEPAEAARVVVPAYLAVHGPAGPSELDQWLTRGASPRRAVRGWFDDLGDALAPVHVDGRPLAARAEDVDALAATRPSRAVRLLPAFDQAVLGPGTAEPLLLDPRRRGEVSRAGGWIAPVLLLGGRVAGTWEVADDALTVTVFAEAAPLPEGALEAEADRVARAAGRGLALRVEAA